MAARAGKKEIAEKAKVHSKVFLGHPEDPDVEGFGLRVELCVEGIEDDDIIAAAHNVSLTAFSLASYVHVDRPPSVLRVQPCTDPRLRGHRRESL